VSGYFLKWCLNSLDSPDSADAQLEEINLPVSGYFLEWRLNFPGLARLCGSPAAVDLSTCEWIFPGVVFGLPGLARLCGSPAAVDLSTCEWIFPGVVLELPGLASSVDPQLEEINLPVSGYFLE
jgi:hypothetical protein